MLDVTEAEQPLIGVRPKCPELVPPLELKCPVCGLAYLDLGAHLRGAGWSEGDVPRLLAAAERATRPA